MIIVHTNKSENRARNLIEDFFFIYPSNRHACQFVNISKVRCPLHLPKVVLIVFEDNERLKFDCESRLNNLIHDWIFKETKFLFVEPEFNWRIPECENKMELAATLPLAIWKINWTDILNNQLNYQPSLG